MHLVVVGGVAAGMSAASRARRLRPDWKITVLERDSVVSYGACGLPFWIEGHVEQARQLIVHTPAYFRDERNIQVRTDSPVLELLPARRRVLLKGGEEIVYDRLILATGARPVAPPIPGAHLPHCFSLRTWDDAHRLQQFLNERRPRRAVIIGAGFVGLEMAEAFLARGLHVTLLDQSTHFPIWRDEWMTARIRAALEAAGVDVNLGFTVRKIHEHGVDDLDADLVLLSAGVRPNAELADRAGIVLGRSGAIAVNEYLETSLPGIYAAGDCAETFHRVLNAPSWIPLGTTANKMGRVAGANAVGLRERFPGVVGTSILRVCGLAVAVTGLSATAARSAGYQAVSAEITAPIRAGYFGKERVDIKLVADRRSGKLLGGAITGETGVEGRINVLATAVGAGLLAEEFQFADLCYTPPYATVWDPLLIAAQQLVKQLA
jgi:NADPH-dependent 2,4-dienoyl-CoA reductase/sulfur reductase-like enzyme